MSHDVAPHTRSPSSQPDGRASLSPASRVGRVPSAWSGSPGRTRPTGDQCHSAVSETLSLDENERHHKAP
ncbi:MAG: hypothetical protein FJ398_19185 [Verrucomicrobia bacterium]|nr:hypothetical protein [Verrucomicrobiota bacterium]